MNIEWIKEQLQAAKVKKPVGNAVMNLLKQMSELELDEFSKQQVVDIFSKLSLGHAFVKENKTEVWVSVVSGHIKVTDQVRIKADAFSGNTGMIHNGRKGVVVAIRYGDIIVNTTDEKSPQLRGSHYPPDKLEKLVTK